MSRFNVIDLARLGRMRVLEDISVEADIIARMGKLKEIWTLHDPPVGALYDTENLEFDPLRINQECNSFFGFLFKDRVNQAARALALSNAFGTDLDNIASRYPVGPRLLNESDDRYRRRTQLSVNPMSPHGPAGAYMYWALTADAALRDASETGIEGTGEVIVTMLNEETRLAAWIANPGTLAELNQALASWEPRPSLERLLAVRTYIATEYRKGATDILTVAPPIVKDIKITVQVWFFPPPDRATLLAAITLNFAKLILEQRWLGYDAARMSIDAAIKQEGVHRANILEPAEDVLVDQRGVVRVTEISISYMGRSE